MRNKAHKFTEVEKTIMIYLVAFPIVILVFSYYLFGGFVIVKLCIIIYKLIHNLFVKKEALEL